MDITVYITVGFTPLTPDVVLTWKDVGGDPYVEGSTVDSVTPGWAVTCGEGMMAEDGHEPRHRAEHEARGRHDSQNQRSNIWNCKLKYSKQCFLLLRNRSLDGDQTIKRTKQRIIIWWSYNTVNACLKQPFDNFINKTKRLISIVKCKLTFMIRIFLLPSPGKISIIKRLSYAEQANSILPIDKPRVCEHYR